MSLANLIGHTFPQHCRFLVFSVYQTHIISDNNTHTVPLFDSPHPVTEMAGGGKEKFRFAMQMWSFPWKPRSAESFEGNSHKRQRPVFVVRILKLFPFSFFLLVFYIEYRGAQREMCEASRFNSRSWKIPSFPAGLIDTKGAHLKRWPGSQGAETPTNPTLPTQVKLKTSTGLSHISSSLLKYILPVVEVFGGFLVISTQRSKGRIYNFFVALAATGRPSGQPTSQGQSHVGRLYCFNPRSAATQATSRRGIMNRYEDHGKDEENHQAKTHDSMGCTFPPRSISG